LLKIVFKIIKIVNNFVEMEKDLERGYGLEWVGE
jgi:hypothetical protein